MRKWLSALVFVALGAVVVAGLIAGPTTSSDRVVALSEKIACPVCEGESVSASQAPIARSIRTLIAEQVEQGLSDGQIEQFYVDRYGEEVLLDPGFSARSLALWAAPFVFLAVGVGAVAARLRPGRGNEGAAAQALEMAEEGR